MATPTSTDDLFRQAAIAANIFKSMTPLTENNVKQWDSNMPKQSRSKTGQIKFLSKPGMPLKKPSEPSMKTSFANGADTFCCPIVNAPVGALGSKPSSANVSGKQSAKKKGKSLTNSTEPPFAGSSVFANDTPAEKKVKPAIKSSKPSSAKMLAKPAAGAAAAAVAAIVAAGMDAMPLQDSNKPKVSGKLSAKKKGKPLTDSTELPSAGSSRKMEGAKKVEEPSAPFASKPSMNTLLAKCADGASRRLAPGNTCGCPQDEARLFQFQAPLAQLQAVNDAQAEKKGKSVIKSSKPPSVEMSRSPAAGAAAAERKDAMPSKESSKPSIKIAVESSEPCAVKVSGKQSAKKKTQLSANSDGPSSAGSSGKVAEAKKVQDIVLHAKMPSPPSTSEPSMSISDIKCADGVSGRFPDKPFVVAPGKACSSTEMPGNPATVAAVVSKDDLLDGVDGCFEGEARADSLELAQFQAVLSASVISSGFVNDNFGSTQQEQQLEQLQEDQLQDKQWQGICSGDRLLITKKCQVYASVAPWDPFPTMREVGEEVMVRDAVVMDANGVQLVPITPFGAIRTACLTFQLVQRSFAATAAPASLMSTAAVEKQVCTKGDVQKPKAQKQQSSTKNPEVTQPLAVKSLASIGVPMKLDNTRYASVDLTGARNSPNRLVPVGQLLWLQDSAHDSFSKGESLWETLAEVASGKKAIYKSKESPTGLDTVRVIEWENKLYSVDTRRPLIYKVAFDPLQLIPVRVVPAETEPKLGGFLRGSVAGNKDAGRTVLLSKRLHDVVPRGLLQLPFIRDVTSHSEVCCSQRYDSDSSVSVSDGIAGCGDHSLVVASGVDDDSAADVIDPGEFHLQAPQLAEDLLYGASPQEISKTQDLQGSLLLGAKHEAKEVLSGTPIIRVRNTFLELTSHPVPIWRAFSAPSATHVALHDSCSNGLADAEENGDVSSTAAGTGTSDEDAIKFGDFQRRSKRW